MLHTDYQTEVLRAYAYKIALPGVPVLPLSMPQLAHQAAIVAIVLYIP